MNLHAMLRARAEAGEPVRIGLIGAGKFGAMFLAQAARTPGLHVMAIADLSLERARDACRRAGWTEEVCAAADFATARASGAAHLTEDAAALIAADGLDVVIEATGNPAAGIGHALAAFAACRHVVMVTVEGDALAGPLLARRAREAGVVYSLAYGDQPALICELVDWARAAGFEVVCAGKGTKYRPEYHASTPETVWDHYGLSAEDAAADGLNPQMFNSFLDGTKSALEMAAVANACGLAPQVHGLGFPPAAADELANVCRPRGDGGALERSGTVEVVSSETRDGRTLAHDLRWGVYVAFEAADDYVRRCFAEYGLATDDSGRYAAMYRPGHLIGLELGISVAAVALRGEPTGCPRAFRADVAAVAKRALAPGDTLDGEGGYTVWGRLMPAADSLGLGALPLGLAHGVRLRNAVAEGAVLRWDDVAFDAADPTVAFRREMEAAFADGGQG
ncbi:MAG: NAD(P)H-dependent oxidoreductase [Alphaproteobacteria bacterium]